MASLKEMREAVNAWAAQEKADIESGKKKVPLTSKEKAMAENKEKPLKTALVRETETRTSRSDLAADFRAVRKAKIGISPEASQMHRLQSAAETGEAQAFVGVMKPSAPHVDTQRAEVPKMRERWDQMQKSIAEQRSSVKPMTLKEKKISKETKTQMAERVYKSQTQTMHSSLAESDLAMVGQSKNPIGEGARDLGRSVTRTIQRGTEGDTELLKIAKGRAKAGLSIAGPGMGAKTPPSGSAPKPSGGKPSGAARPSMRNSLKAKFGGAAGKLGGKLGAYGMIKGVLEGAETLRKMKSGAYDLTPEGGTKLKKGYTES